MAVEFTRTDLDRLLQMLIDMETGTPPVNPHLAFGFRELAGTNNNQVPGQSTFGSADQPFANATSQYFQTVTINVDGTPFDYDPNPGTTLTTTYASTDPNLLGSNAHQVNVIDPAPRIISNLISDISANNPAAVAVAQAFAAQLGDGYTAFVSNPTGLILPGDDGKFGTADDQWGAGADGKFGNEDDLWGVDGLEGTTDDLAPRDFNNLFIGNITPDAGLSAPFNNWMTFFGQFFDHGLDLISKGGNGYVYIPLAPDDPLITLGQDGIAGTGDELTDPSKQFMIMTRASDIEILPGADGKLGTSDDIHRFRNEISPFVDQNQTYASDGSHNAFLREYMIGVDGKLHSSGKMLRHESAGVDGILRDDPLTAADESADNTFAGMATWADLKQNALKFGLQLTDHDVGNVPLLATDAYGNLLLTATGQVQILVDIAGVPTQIALNAASAQTLAQIEAATGGTVMYTGHAFINDMAHAASPFDNAGTALIADSDDVTGLSENDGLHYDDELLDAHYVAGDGRVNENIALTTVHAIFHDEHNRLVDSVKALIQAQLDAGDTAFASAWVLPGTVLTPGTQIADNEWNGERLMQVAKFGTETQYQHLVFEEFARKVAPTIHLFGNVDIHLDAAITSEFANAVYRFGHSMLDENVPLYQLNPDGTMALDANGQPIMTDMGLIEAFTNPLAFANLGDTGLAQIIQGTTHQIGSEIDEFVTGALRNNLLGLPLDLAALNIARGRDAGVAPLNLVRAQIYDATHDVTLKPYANWAEFGQFLKHPESLINFIAAYGTHSSITGAADLNAKRAAAMNLILNGLNPANNLSDEWQFMHSTGIYANDASNPLAVHAQWTTGSITGVDNIDLWIGGLAEKQNLFGGLLGSTFNFIFETQLEALQDGDRLYYLPRIEGLDFGFQIENNSFADMIIANTGAKHISASIFLTPEYTVEAGSVTPDPATWLKNPVTGAYLVERLPDGTVHFIGDDNFFGNTIVLGGTDGNDRLQAGHADDDTVWGDGGNDWIDGGNGDDFLYGGTGDDTIVDSAGADVIHGEAGNDSVYAGLGDDIVFLGSGDDYAEGGMGIDEIQGGAGNDIIKGGEDDDSLIGNEGDDWLEGGDGGDGLVGDTGAPTGMVPLFAANDVLDGGGNGDKMVGFSGDDIMMGQGGFDKFNGLLGFDWADFEKEDHGVSIDMERRVFVANAIAPAGDAIRDFFVETEAASGTRFNDFMEGTEDNGLAAGVFNELQNVNLIFNLDTFFVGGQAANWDANGVVINDGTGYNTGNILLGGDGSDTITGRAGNDIIDGDAYLHVYLSGDGLAGSEIQREIGWDITEGDIDTAVYRDVMANYTIDFTPDENGFITVRHNGTVGGAINGVRIPVNEGTDKIRNIERLQFADGVINIDQNPNANLPPTGQLLITDDDADPATPVNAFVGTALTVDLLNSTLTDPDGINLATVHYQWQQEIVTPGGGQAWIDIAGATGTSFTPTNANLGNLIRVVETYTDNKGLVEHAYSQPTALVVPPVVPTTNTAPFIVNQQGMTGLPDTNARTGYPINLFLPLTQTFGDNETNANNLLYSASLSNGQPLPAGLTFTLIPDAVNGGVSGATITGTVNVAGPISIKITATDTGPGTALTVTDTFVINVQTGNLAPSVAAAPESNTTLEDTAVSGQLLAGTDLDGPVPVWRLVQGSATNGTISLNGNTGQYVFTPSLDLSSDDLNGTPPVFSFQYRVFDGLTFSAPKTVLINVDAVDDGVAPVTITGTAAAGGTLSALIGIDADGPWQNGSETFQWYRDGIAIDGATNADLVLTQDDVGHQFTVHAGYTDAQGFVYTDEASAAADVGSVSLSGISGGGTPSRILASNTLSDPDGGIQEGTVSYTWEISADGINFEPTATGVSLDTTTYTPPAPPNGSPPNSGYVRVTVTYIDVLGNLNTTTSDAVHYVVDNGQTHTFSGTAMAELIFGNGGADQITGLEGNDFVQGGGGGDTFFATAGDGDDTYDGGNGNDTYNLSLTAAGATVTLINGGTGTAASAETGADLLVSVENVVGSAGNDIITGNNAGNIFTGGAGNDTLDGAGGNDTAVYSGSVGNYAFSLSGANLVVTDARGGSPDGSDTLISMDTIQFGNLALNLVHGTNGNNPAVNGGNGADLVLGLDGNDTLNGNGSADVLVGGAGNDTLNGGAGNDTAVFSGPLSAYTFAAGVGGTLIVTDTRGGSPDGTDTLSSIQSIQFGSQTLGLAFGSNNADNVNGGSGADLLLGLDGNDELDGGAGADLLRGGAGFDDFNFAAGDTGVGAGNRDIILDFLGGGGQEDIDVSAIDANTTTAGNGTFSFIGTAAFSDANASAQLAVGQIRYQLFDSDGNGSLDSTLIQGNVNNDLAPDFEIVLQGYTGPLVAGDFIL